MLDKKHQKNPSCLNLGCPRKLNLHRTPFQTPVSSKSHGRWCWFRAVWAIIESKYLPPLCLSLIIWWFIEGLGFYPKAKCFIFSAPTESFPCFHPWVRIEFLCFQLTSKFFFEAVPQIFGMPWATNALFSCSFPVLFGVHLFLSAIETLSFLNYFWAH